MLLNEASTDAGFAGLATSPTRFLHLHFGAGRLGLGLVAPFFHTPSSELHILNRRVPAAKETASSGVDSQRRNGLLHDSTERHYLVENQGSAFRRHEVVTYAGFHTYNDFDLEDVVGAIARAASPGTTPVVVTASILNLAAYACIVRALSVLCTPEAAGDPVRPVFLVSCENMLTAEQVMRAPEHAHLVTPEAAAGVICVDALVDRICIALQEAVYDGKPTLVVRTEAHGELTLQLTPRTSPLKRLCQGSRVRFSRHVEVEMRIKGWLLNGGHALLAVEAFQAAKGDRSLKLNEFLTATDERRRYATQLMHEMRQGIAALLRSDPAYADFVAEVDVDAYLADRAATMLERFFTTEDPITRVLGRFQAPLESVAPVEAFAQRLAARVNPPLDAYERQMGFPPPAASRAMFSLYALIASGRFVNLDLDPASPVLFRAEAAVAVAGDNSEVPDPLQAQTYMFTSRRAGSRPPAHERLVA